MPNREKPQEFVAWCQNHITGDEKGAPVTARSLRTIIPTRKIW
jgi:hypothetical protein